MADPTCPCQPDAYPFVCLIHGKRMSPHLVHLCQTKPAYREKWERERDGSPRQRPPRAAWLTCEYRGEPITTLPGRLAGAGCASSRVDVYQCSFFDEPVLKHSPARCRNAIIEQVPGYTGRTCRECDVPNQPLLPIPTAALTLDSARGIVTGANEQHWPCLGALAIAAHEQGLGFAVADHGLSDDQRTELNRVGVRWIEHEQPKLTPATRERQIIAPPNAWWKPWVCLASPFERSAWIDSDAVATGDLVTLFDSSQPLVSDQSAFIGGGDRLYNRLLAVAHNTTPASKIYQRFQSLNSGVLAWSRAEDMIDEWAVVTATYLRNPAIVEACNVRDQSSLLSVLMRRAERGQNTEMLDPAWNWPADGLTHERLKNRQRVARQPKAFLADARQRHPAAKIVHWLARPKPWDLYD